MYRNFPTMSEDDIDRYLDKCETILLSTHSKTTDAGPFPLLPPSSVPPKTQAPWTAFDPTYKHPSPPSEDHLTPGQAIESHDAQDVTGTLPKDYEVILKSAAEVIGVKGYDVGIVVELFERRLEGIRKERSRSRSRSKSRGGRGVSAGRKKRGTI
jgi:RNA polymerase I-specific transcription initiation factor RRN7